MNFRASISAALAAASAFNVSSAAARSSAAERSQRLDSSMKTLAASITRFAKSSALVTSPSASASNAFFFLVIVEFFRSASLLASVSSWPWYCLIFPCACSLGPFENRFASTSFVARNMRAMETAVFADVEAASQAFTAASVSSMGNSSTPIRKGPSASAAFDTASETAWSLSPASLRTSPHETSSAASLHLALKSDILCSDTLQRSSTFSSCSRAKCWAERFL
mmetsp:Transcript_11224/g.29934  ORF Transcript_11224/g.29934 Transcript_11224/m.29934 type:complete len:224 (-) Transcript_11224:1051-1722(-)